MVAQITNLFSCDIVESAVWPRIKAQEINLYKGNPNLKKTGFVGVGKASEKKIIPDKLNLSNYFAH